ncbi:PKD domain-containing protein [Thermopirellula anaerolimosa]
MTGRMRGRHEADRSTAAATVFSGVLGIVLVLAATGSPALGQNFRRGGQEFLYLRPIALPADASAPIVVVEFYHHGAISSDGKNVIVATGNELPPMRVLQLGPGDFCRLAFQTISTRAPYEILYGGPAFPDDRRPAWTAEDGLLLETREYRDCNLNSLDSVRQAFAAAKPFGADYVTGIQHAGNPFTLSPAPYFSRYSGVLNIARGGVYGFFTSSQDCSFLLIDGKVVAEAPGRHPPTRWATPDTRRDIRLEAGRHRFEYYHASTTEAGMAVAAWEVDPKAPKPAAPTAIPPEVFRADVIVRPQVGPPSAPDQRFLPDFNFRIVSDVPLPDNDVPMIAVEFAEAGPSALAGSPRIVWDFGDGQTAEGAKVGHVFLRPGIYSVRLSLIRAGRPFQITNRIQVDRPRLKPQDKALTLDDVTAVLEGYQPAKLDAPSLLQLVSAYLAKADQYLPPPPPNTIFVDEDQAATSKPQDLKTLAQQRIKYQQAALDAVKTVFSGPAEGTGEESVWLQLAALGESLAREVFGDAAAAVAIRQGCLARVRSPGAKAECLVAVADIMINDLADPNAAKPQLDEAERLLSGNVGNSAANRAYQRVLGDYYAAVGNSESAVAAYRRAEELASGRRNDIERTAWRGAHSRSTEEFLQNAEWERAIHEIRLWQDEFPADMIEGYLPLLTAKYWAGRKRHDLVTALADRLLAVNPYSPYIEELLVLSAQSDVARGQVDRAVATLESLLKDYPGSPLVGEARQMLEKLRQSPSRLQ